MCSAAQANLAVNQSPVTTSWALLGQVFSPSVSVSSCVIRGDEGPLLEEISERIHLKCGAPSGSLISVPAEFRFRLFTQWMKPLQAAAAENMQCAPCGPPIRTLPATERTAPGCEQGHCELGPLTLCRVEWAHTAQRDMATYRWERDVRSWKEPSGTLEMSLPWRVLR